MQPANIESVFLKVLKWLLLVIIGSGLLGNALYIYGLGYYQGYINALGFEYNFFPIEWKDTLLWSYEASREIGLSSLGFFNRFTIFLFAFVSIAIYLIVIYWIRPTEDRHSTRQKKPSSKNTAQFGLVRKIFRVKRRYRWFYRISLSICKWFINHKKESFFAFSISYFSFIFMILLPFFFIVWAFFPLLGVSHGELVAGKRLKYYEENLCGGSNVYWSQCIEIDVPDLERYSDQVAPIGRLLFKNDVYVAILTAEGPVTLTMPEQYYFKTPKNPCYGKGCDDKQQGKQDTQASEL